MPIAVCRDDELHDSEGMANPCQGLGDIRRALRHATTCDEVQEELVQVSRHLIGREPPSAVYLRDVLNGTDAAARVAAHPDGDVVLANIVQDVIGHGDEVHVCDDYSSLLLSLPCSALDWGFTKVQMTTWSGPEPAAITNEKEPLVEFDETTNTDVWNLWPVLERGFQGCVHFIHLADRCMRLSCGALVCIAYG